MNKQALQEAIDNLSILMVYLRSSELKFYNDFDPLIPSQELIGQYNIKTISCVNKEAIDDQEASHNFLVYQAEARMRYLKGPISEELKNEIAVNEQLLDDLTAAEIVAVFCAEYAIKEDSLLSNEAILEFGRVNVPHQVWPYWREYCHSTCSRMALPVTILPMLAINKSIDADRQ